MVKQVSLVIDHGLSDMISKFDELSKPPFKTIFRLETELKATFTSTQAAVHHITSSLWHSGRTESDFDGDNWSGQIIYGGASGWVNDPVEYAIYERARGGEHDFLAPADAHEQNFEDIIDRHFGDVFND